MFGSYARGDMSTQEVTREAQAAGLVFRKSGGRIPKSTVAAILRNRIYTGRFDWDGKTYQGSHEAIVPAELWERVQDMMDGRSARGTKKGRRNFAFSGLIVCHACGCAVVGEIKKERYVYYHCTGYADKCEGKPASCRRKYIREEVLGAKFTELLGRLRFDHEVLEWLREALHASHADERRGHEEAIKRLEAECKRLSDRIHAMYVDKLDGLVDTALFEKMSNQWREEQSRCQREIARHLCADRSYLSEGIALLDLARNAQRLFAKQEPHEKRRLLNFLLSNCTWDDGKVVATFRQPFDILAETIIETRNGNAPGGASERVSEKWLPGADSNHRPSG
jgi:site-specific DNA recombinase